MNEYALNSNEKNFLEEARTCAQKARVLPRIDVFKACELVQFNIELITPEILNIFIRSLPQAFGRPATFYPPATNQLSWDEKWLVSLASAVSRADFDSVHFLITSCVKPRHQKQCHTLAAQLWKIRA